MAHSSTCFPNTLGLIMVCKCVHHAQACSGRHYEKATAASAQRSILNEGSWICSSPVLQSHAPSICLITCAFFTQDATQDQKRTQPISLPYRNGQSHRVSQAAASNPILSVCHRHASLVIPGRRLAVNGTHVKMEAAGVCLIEM